MNKVKIPILKMLIKFVKKKYVLAGSPVIIQNSKGEILLGKRAKDHVFYPSSWGLPGGIIEYSESVVDAVKREAKEELGVKIKIIKRAKNIYEHFPNKDCSIHTIDIPYYAKIVKGKPKPKDETSLVKWFNPHEIKNMKLAYSYKEILRGEGLI